MKKILHIISQYPGRTGSGIYFNQLIEEGEKRGYQQAFIGAIDDVDYRNPYIESENSYLVKFNSESLPFNIPGMSDEMPYESKRYSDMSQEDLKLYKESFTRIIRKAIEEFEPDLIFTHHLWIVSSLVTELAQGIKVVAICHGTDIRQLEKIEYLREEVTRGIRRADLVLALNEDQRNIISREYRLDRSKIIKIGGGYRQDVFYPDFQDRDNIALVYAGKISYSKGVMSALKAVDRIGNKKGISFKIIGSGKGKQYKEILSYGKGIDMDVDFIGEVAQEELGNIFRTCDIFIMPSYYEGLSLVTIEAIASGLLVVSSDIKGLIEFLGDEINNSGIIEYAKLPKSEEDISRYEEDLKHRIEKQISRLKNRETIYSNIDDRIKELSWESIYREIDRIIKGS